MLVATFVLVMILGMTLQIIKSANDLFLGTRKRIDTFQEARAGFEVMTRKISQAMLNTYWDYANGTVGSGTGTPRPQPSHFHLLHNVVSHPISAQFGAPFYLRARAVDTDLGRHR